MVFISCQSHKKGILFFLYMQYQMAILLHYKSIDLYKSTHCDW